MASAAAIGIMREAAHKRLASVTSDLLSVHGIPTSEYTNLSKDPDIAVVRTLEAIATDLEALRDAQEAANKTADQGESNRDAPEAALLTAVLDGNADTVKARIATIDNPADLTAVRSIEEARGAKARKTVIAAVEARLAELEA